MQDISVYGLKFLESHYPERLKERYKLIDIPTDIVQLFNHIGQLRGCLVSGGQIDYDKTAEVIIRDLRMQHFGKITFDIPNEDQTAHSN